MLNCVTKMRSFALAGTMVVLLSASGTASRAEDTNASPTPYSGNCYISHSGSCNIYRARGCLTHSGGRSNSVR